MINVGNTTHKRESGQRGNQETCRVLDDPGRNSIGHWRTKTRRIHHVFKLSKNTHNSRQPRPFDDYVRGSIHDIHITSIMNQRKRIALSITLTEHKLPYIDLV